MKNFGKYFSVPTEKNSTNGRVNSSASHFRVKIYFTLQLIHPPQPVGFQVLFQAVTHTKSSKLTEQFFIYVQNLTQLVFTKYFMFVIFILHVLHIDRIKYMLVNF